LPLHPLFPEKRSLNYPLNEGLSGH